MNLREFSQKQADLGLKRESNLLGEISKYLPLTAGYKQNMGQLPDLEMLREQNGEKKTLIQNLQKQKISARQKQINQANSKQNL